MATNPLLGDSSTAEGSSVAWHLVCASRMLRASHVASPCSNWQLGCGGWGWLGPPFLPGLYPPDQEGRGGSRSWAASPAQTFLTSCPVQLSGLALFAETVWVTADQYRVYPLMGVSGKDDVFAGAWIAIFCGFSFFVVASFGVGAALCRRRSMTLTVRPQEWGGQMDAERHHSP